MQLYDKDLDKALGKAPTLFLFQLAYWSKKCGRKEDGKVWVYNTQEEWASQLGISRRTLCSAVDKLKRLGLVSTSFRAKNRYNRTLSYALEVPSDTTTFVKEVLLKMHSPLPADSTPHCLPVAQCKSNKTTPQKRTEEEVVAGSNKSTDREKSEQGIGREEENKKLFSSAVVLEGSALTNGESSVVGNKGKSIAEIAEGLKQSKGGAIKGTPYSLMMKWNQIVGDQTGKFQVSPTQKEVGQMKLIVKKSPPDLLLPLIEKVLGDWHGFTLEVRIATGTLVSPSSPHVGYLLTHLQVAVNWATIVKPVEKLTSGTGAVDFTPPPKPEKLYHAAAWNKSPKPKLGH